MTFPFHIVDSEATLENKLIVKKGYKHGGGWVIPLYEVFKVALSCFGHVEETKSTVAWYG